MRFKLNKIKKEAEKLMRQIEKRMEANDDKRANTVAGSRLDDKLNDVWVELDAILEAVKNIKEI
jgi:hypothetical protein